LQLLEKKKMKTKKGKQRTKEKTLKIVKNKREENKTSLTKRSKERDIEKGKGNKENKYNEQQKVKSKQTRAGQIERSTIDIIKDIAGGQKDN
jgi:hypothetical protein